MNVRVVGVPDCYRSMARRIAREHSADCRVHTVKRQQCVTYTSDDNYGAKACANLLIRGMECEEDYS